ncbi:transcription antitermination factor NusB [Candidatus Roizmanbacteria bacterium RIFCSPHIGHO2_02_FULL_37_15]|uniref:Transcription antitermination protein NusB n=1 Tax=Candidatus Roizmanbacteria bacterium RIFCSPLOWO2_01_FULL_37_16 TaxID=1802058 RepID=A0A1F7IKR2_9BACT|nr:MAG: transcription antitermination factor NusB [Candidatus Roizmanbacteria bacterium RIFCSPHIGHO2_01_FULL_37_16b]OGK22277.1 MAG: transcription antitermination factor NusB [Candidatus Roizmanbacteria bacterium RIFCSPHIGHO2_02_FULL_37_15]OGK31790.1 MAG: transcription antitermination factor NusB [Candidatus Roizmanbacteria bacterium RIFCSPHIGHO2_12_FULL_36_11]OGK43949.1 MAG: transcription antitermination factor NusB [Candidatus Roizmanbacteria bacterium RIFCSPLOWO2_01_FULL_37_16]OGK56442.1 MAG:
MDPRHQQRIKIVQNLFAFSYNNKNNLPHPNDNKTQKIIKKLSIIDQYIKTYAPRYPLENIAKTDLSILRLAIYELMFEKNTPIKVVINEAVELAKEVSGENSYAFINAILGKVLSQTPSLGNKGGSI